MALRRVPILLILFIFAMIARAWCDPVKSIDGAAVQLTTMKMGGNKAAMLKKTEPAKGSREWLKKSQASSRDANFLRAPEETEGAQWVQPLDRAIYPRELSENVRRNKFSNPLHAMETKSTVSDSGQSTLKAYSDDHGSFEQARTFTKLKLLQSREETFKEIFMGVCFSLDLTNGHVLLQVNVTPSTERGPGFLIRF